MMMTSTATQVLAMAKKAKKASQILALASSAQKNKALAALAEGLMASQDYLIKENAKDLKAAQTQALAKALIDRLTLNPQRIKDMADSVRATMRLADPIGQLLEKIQRPNGLIINKVRVSLGVVGIVFESRPNVTSDCASLCIKSGNAAILKGGREAFYSNQAIYKVIQQALVKAKLPKEAVQLIASTDRAAIGELLKLDDYVDVIVPRGGESLIRYVVEHTRIPVIKHFKGVCHVYVSKDADLLMAKDIVLNAKLQKPGVCNAMETLLIDQKIAKKFLPSMASLLMDAHCQLRGDQASCALVKGMLRATDKDWSTEYLDLILSVRIVHGLHEAITHINTYGSKHSDAIVTKNSKEAAQFLKEVDSACVYVNASTRFTDGFEFGFGSEVGISTDKMHVRGPMALEGLTSYKYQIFGSGQIRQ